MALLVHLDGASELSPGSASKHTRVQIAVQTRRMGGNLEMKSRAEPKAPTLRGRTRTQSPPAKINTRVNRSGVIRVVLIVLSIASFLSLQAEVTRQVHAPIPPQPSATRPSEAQVTFPNRSSFEPRSRSSKEVPSQRSRPQSSHAASPLNVLMILIDDLRPALGCYGDSLAVTPSIDALANQSVRFDAAYASVATCSPSRTSLLIGLRPDTHGVHDLETHFRTTVPDATTLPQAFKRAGYLALSYGKVFHEALDDAASWSSQADFDDGEVWRGTERAYGHDWWYMEWGTHVESAVLVVPRLASLASWGDSPGSWSLHSFGTSRCAAQGQWEAAVRP